MVSTELKKEDNRHLLSFNLNCFNRDVIHSVIIRSAILNSSTMMKIN
jgi:hypothetical protein